MLAPHFQQGEMKLDLLPDREPYNNHTHIKVRIDLRSKAISFLDPLLSTVFFSACAGRLYD